MRCCVAPPAAAAGREPPKDVAVRVEGQDGCSRCTEASTRSATRRRRTSAASSPRCSPSPNAVAQPQHGGVPPSSSPSPCRRSSRSPSTAAEAGRAPGSRIHETTREPRVVKRRGIRSPTSDARWRTSTTSRSPARRVVRGLIRPDETHVAPDEIQRRAPHAEAHPRRRPARRRWSTTNSAPTCSTSCGSTSVSCSRSTPTPPTAIARPSRRTARATRDLTAWGFRMMRATDRQLGVRDVARLAATLSR